MFLSLCLSCIYMTVFVGSTAPSTCSKISHSEFLYPCHCVTISSLFLGLSCLSLCLLLDSKLISSMVFVMVEMSAFPCLCRWISNCINLLLSVHSWCVPLHVCVSLGLYHQVCICVTLNLFLCPYRFQVLCFCVLFSSHIPCLHAIMSMCFYLSVLGVIQ